MNSGNHRVSVVFECRDGHRHQLCITVGRGVPPELRCGEGAPAGYGHGGGGGCQVPADLRERVERVLRDDLLEARRRGFVLVSA